MSGSAIPHFIGVALVLGLVAWSSPPPMPTDQAMMERVGQGKIIPGCADLNCFRILVPAVVESFPGPPLPRWRAYAVLANSAAAVATGRLALAFGLAPGAATLTIWLSGLGAGSLSMVHHPFNADPFVLFLAPVTTLLLIRNRHVAAAVLSTIGVFAKEFAAAPMFIAAAASALARDWRAFLLRGSLAIGVTSIWLCLQLVLMSVFLYSYNENPSARPLEGGYLRVWLREMPPLSAALGLFGTFGALNLLIPLGWTRAPIELRRLAIGALPALAAFVYVATPERALWNFFFLAVPLGALVLAELPAAFSRVFVACFALANLRIGAQIPGIPASRYAVAASLLIAGAALIQAWRAPAVAPRVSDSPS